MTQDPRQWPLAVTSDSPAATKAVAARLASVCGPGDIVLLIGDLGAGKTAFAQGFAAALGVDGPVTSPTFTLVRQYRCGARAPVDLLIHADVYRTGSLSEVADLALAELVEERAIALVEWGDVAAPALGDDALEVTLARPGSPDPADTDARTITFNGRGRWQQAAGDVARALSAAGSATTSTSAGTP
jgi:tRNA threonylcarbamoyladenosine biosynthesis protein TsaE